VQAPHDTQGFNRYAYVRNNPLRYTDPSGFCYQTGPAASGESQCIEEIFVKAPRIVPDSSPLFGSGPAWFPMHFGQVPQGRFVGDGLVEEVMVLGERLPATSTTEGTPTLPQLGIDLTSLLQQFVRSPYFDDLILTSILALLEPTPAGEVALAGQLATSASRALVPYYPPANGFLGATRQVTLAPGARIDRFGGSAYSQFFSPIGTPMQTRSLPPFTATQPLRAFEVLQPIQVEAGQVAPWFGQMGLGTQFRSARPLGEMLENQILKEVGP